MSRLASLTCAWMPPLLAALVAPALPGCSGPRLEHVPAQGALGPYSAAVLTEDLCFLSGKIGDAAARQAGFDREVESAIDALEADLRRSGLSLDDVLMVTVYVTDMARYAELNDIYGRRFHEPWPARATVAVTALPAGAKVELAAVARRR